MLYLNQLAAVVGKSFKKFCFNILLPFQTILLSMQLQLFEFLVLPHNNGTAFCTSLTVLDSSFMKYYGHQCNNSRMGAELNL